MDAAEAASQLLSLPLLSSVAPLDTGALIHDRAGVEKMVSHVQLLEATMIKVWGGVGKCRQILFSVHSHCADFYLAPFLPLFISITPP